jgi:hypothetical protein
MPILGIKRNPFPEERSSNLKLFVEEPTSDALLPADIHTKRKRKQ